MPGDNFHIELRSEGRTHFDAAVKIAFANAPGGKATHYISPLPERSCLECSGTGKSWKWRGKESFDFPCGECAGTGKAKATVGIVLFWHEDSVADVKSSLLPFPLTADTAPEFLWAYLQGAEFGNQPDHDGSNGKGYFITSGNGWGHVEGSHYAFLGVYPAWQMYGK